MIINQFERFKFKKPIRKHYGIVMPFASKAGINRQRTKGTCIGFSTFKIIIYLLFNINTSSFKNHTEPSIALMW